MMDVDGVLVHGRPEDGRHWSTSLHEDLGLHPHDLHREFFAVHWEDVVLGRATLEDSLAPVLQRIAPLLSPELLISYWLERDSRLNLNLLQELTRIRATGLQIHLATNQEHRRARYLMDTLALAHHVEGIHYSAGLGVRKPFRGFFDQVTATVTLPPCEILLVDDSLENIRGAEAAGWKALHWTGEGSGLATLVARF